MNVSAKLDDKTIINVVNEIKQFATDNRIKIGEIRYCFNLDTYEKTYKVRCNGRGYVSETYFEKENAFENSMCEKYEIDQIYFEDCLCDALENFCVIVECSKEFKI